MLRKLHFKLSVCTVDKRKVEISQNLWPFQNIRILEDDIKDHIF